VIGTLLAKCADNEFAALDMTSMVAETELPIIGAMMVKISEQGHVNDMAMKMNTLGASQLCRFQDLGNLSDL